MKEEYLMELPSVEKLAKNACEIFRVQGVNKLNVESATQLGFYDRVGNLIALMATAVAAADMVYDNISAMLNDFGVKQHEIKKTCTDYEKAFDRFYSFWLREGYLDKKQIPEIEKDCETLYHMIMRWGCLPENWQLGDNQKVDADTDVLIKVDAGDRVLKFRHSVDKREDVEEPNERWCVTRVNRKDETQFVIYDDMSKADANVIAKRFSSEDPDNYYTASLIKTSVQKITETTPMKIFKANESVGNAMKYLKKKSNGL